MGLNKKILQVFVLLFFFFNVSLANDFRDIRKISLNKDEEKKILVKYGSVEKLFKFRWSLYTNGGLVVLRSYDSIVAQNILYNSYKNNSFMFYLKPHGSDDYNIPYILVKFKEFNYEKNKAIFELFLSDDEMQIILKYLKIDIK